MARNIKKKALYEVIGKAKLKTPYDKKPEQLHPKKPGPAGLIREDSSTPVAGGVSGWPKRASIVQFNADRIDISISYQIAIALLLGGVLLLLVVFRLGQANAGAGDVDEKIVENIPEDVVRTTKPPGPVEKIGQDTVPTEPAKSKGNNRIVIKQYPRFDDLAEAKKHFDEFGIETEIRKIGGNYWLITVNKYENPGRAGTDGYEALQRIKQVGAKYKAPPGYDTFGRKPFQDVYGKRFDD